MQQVITPKGGMNLDLSGRYITEGHYKYAMNCNTETDGNSLMSLASDIGNTLIASGKEGYDFIGAIPTDTSSFVVFSTNGSIGEVGLFDPLSGFYETYISTADLNFDSSYLIKGIFRVRNGCERVVYFTDTVNPFRIINLDALDTYQDSAGNWDVETMKFSRSFIPLQYTNIEVEDNGGSHRVGAKQLAYRYVDQDGNSTSWSYPTTPIYITDDPLNGPWNNINGAYDDEFYTVKQGGVPRTSKRIKVEVSNLDTSFTYIQFALLESLEGLGTVTNTFSLSPIEIVNTSQTIYINGTENQIDEEISLAEIQIDRELIHIVNSLEQTDNSLFLGGVKTSEKDIADLQRAASQVQVDFEMSLANHRRTDHQGNPHGYDYISYPSDEVLALGIVYHYDDGYSSPVCHIPGRNIDQDRSEGEIISTWTEDLLPWATEDDFNNNYAKNVTELAADPDAPVLYYWQVYNSAYYTDSNLIGKMAYHESSSSTYPNIKDCDGNSIWGTDSDGIPLAGKAIRHHRMPSRRLVGLVSNENNLRLIGVKFSNISYPSDNIIGHSFVRAVINEEDKTVVDRGIVYRASKRNGESPYYAWEPRIPISHLNNLMNASVTNEALVYVSPRVLFDSNLPSGDYMRYEARYPKSDNFTETESISTPGLFNGKINIFTSVLQRAYKPTLRPTGSSLENIAIDSSVIVNPERLQNSFGNFGNDMLNTSKSQQIGFIHPTLDSDFDLDNLEWTPLEDVDYYDSRAPYFMSIKRNIDPYSNLSSLTYVPLHNNVLSLTDSQSIRTGGSTVISPMNVFSILSIDEQGFLSSGEVVAYYGSQFWIESEFNFSMRVPGTTKCDTIYIDGSGQPFYEYIIDKVAQNYDPVSGDIEVDVDNICEEYYAYNRDLTKLNNEKVYIPIPFNYDYCDECDGEHYDRVYYSEKDNQESISDNYRLIRVNNYTTLSGQGNRITDLLVDKDELYAVTRNYNYYIPIREQRIQTSDAIAYLGSAERLSQPAKRLVSPKFSYGGCLDRMGIVGTPFGVAYVSRLEGKVFMLSSSLDEISSRGMRAFFKKNLEFELNKAFKRATQVDYPYMDSIINRNSVGLSMTFDPTFSRLILSKKDYIPKYPVYPDTTANRSSSTTGIILANADGTLYYKALGYVLRIFPYHTNYFTEDRWTISYDLRNQVWKSFHSYEPELMFNNEKAFYTTKDNNLYEHYDNKQLNYYGEDHEAFIEVVGNDQPLQKKSFDSIKLLTDTMPFQIMTYNQYMNTGKQNIIFGKDFIRPGIGEVKAVYSEDKINIPLGRNYNIEAPTVSEDIIPEPLNIDFNKSQFRLDRIKSDYSNIRIYWNTPFILDGAILDYTLMFK